jgi:ribosomal protein S18 acetylase RimI-like enzyme
VSASATAIAIRPADRGDAARLAELHVAGIAEGFLATLGSRFLTALYRRITDTADSFAFVAVGAHGDIIGFCAGTLDISGLYREFLRRDGVPAAIRSLGPILRSLPRVIETLRYPARVDVDLPRAEILSVVVADGARGSGIGRRVVDAAVTEFASRGVTRVKVVAGADNVAAGALYRAAGFVDEHPMAVHAGAASIAYVRAPSAPRP